MFLLFLCTAEAGEFTLSFLLFSFLSCFFFFFFSFPEGATVALPALLGSRAPVSLGGGVRGCQREILHTSGVLVFKSGEPVFVRTPGDVPCLALVIRGALCSWDAWDYNDGAGCSWQATTLMSLYRQQTNTHLPV